MNSKTIELIKDILDNLDYAIITNKLKAEIIYNEVVKELENLND